MVVNLKDGKGKAQDTEIGDSEQPAGYLWKTKGWNLEKGPGNFCFMWHSHYTYHVFSIWEAIHILRSAKVALVWTLIGLIILCWWAMQYSWKDSSSVCVLLIHCRYGLCNKFGVDYNSHFDAEEYAVRYDWLTLCVVWGNMIILVMLDS